MLGLRARLPAAVIVLLGCGLLLGPGSYGLVTEVLRANGIIFAQAPVRAYWLLVFWLGGLGLAALRLRAGRPVALRGFGLYLVLLASIHTVLGHVIGLLGQAWRNPEMAQYDGIVDLAYAVLFLPSYLLNLPAPLLEITLPSLLWSVLVYLIFFTKRVLRV